MYSDLHKLKRILVNISDLTEQLRQTHTLVKKRVKVWVIEQLSRLATGWKWNKVRPTCFWLCMSLSQSNHRAQHFLSSLWPHFQLWTPQSTTALAGLTSTLPLLALVVCLSLLRQPDLKPSLWFLPASASRCSFSLLGLWAILLVLRQTCTPLAYFLPMWLEMSSPFSLRFLLSCLSSPGIIWHSLILFLTIFLQRGDISSPFSSLLWLFGIFFPSFIHLVLCPVIIDCSEGLCAAAPVLSGPVRCWLKSIHW